MKTKTWTLSSLFTAFSLALMLSLGACNNAGESAAEESQEQSAEENHHHDGDGHDHEHEQNQEHPSSNEHPN